MVVVGHAVSAETGISSRQDHQESPMGYPQCDQTEPIFGTRADGGASFALNYPPGGPISAIFVTQADGGASFFFVFLLAGRFQRRFSSILSPIAL